MCTAHSIEARDLFNAVLTDINRFADMAVNDEKAVRAIEKRLTETDQSKAKELEKEQRKLNKRLAELDRLCAVHMILPYLQMCIRDSSNPLKPARIFPKQKYGEYCRDKYSHMAE